MARIKVNGRYFDVDDVVLEIPSVCSVDFMSGIVIKKPENIKSRIEGRLIVLLDYLYHHRDGYTSLDTIINDLYDGFTAEGTVKADINSLRKRIYDQKADGGNYQIIQNARGWGYRLMLHETGKELNNSSVPGQNEAANMDDDEGTLIDRGSYRKKQGVDACLAIPRIDAMLIRMCTGECFPVRETRLRIGSSRYPEDRVDIVLPDSQGFNRVHAEIFCDGENFFLCEPKMSSATQVDGHILLEGESVQLGKCSELILGDELFFFLFDNAKKFVTEEGLVCAICSRDSGETRLLLDDPILMDRHHPWRQGVLKSRRISRSSHAQLYRKEGQSFLMDMGSVNGTFFNKRCLVPEEAVVLHTGDSIEIADTSFNYYEVALIFEK